MNPYELMLIFDPNLGEERVKQILAKIEEKVKGLGAEHTKTDIWGSRRIAGSFQKVKRLTHAVYIVIYFNAPTSVPSKLQAFLKVTENLLRYSVYRAAEKKEKPLAEIEGKPLEEKNIPAKDEKVEKLG